MISPESIEQLKLRIDIVDIVSTYISVKKSGSAYVCICPFHDDRNPSMSINPHKGFYHCFSCGAGGDAIKFVMEYEKLTYPEAIEKIANLCNFSLTYTASKEPKKEDKRILEQLNLLYRENLKRAHEARRYLFSRSLTGELIERFELGWAGSSAQSLTLLQKNDITLEEALAVGAVKQNEEGFYASFINRITFPIRDFSGMLVGFGGRTLGNNPAKYVNSPDSEIFNKSRILYAYDKAKKSALALGELVICEGYMDCIAFHASGVTNAVAVLGTALTESHIPLLKKGDLKVILCFDADKAGQGAAVKSARLLAQNAIDGRVTFVPSGKDPAELFAAQRGDVLKDVVSGGVEFGEFVVRSIIENAAPKTPLEVEKTLGEVKEFCSFLSEIVANSYERLVGELLGLKAGSFVLTGGENSNLRANLRVRAFAKSWQSGEHSAKNIKDHAEFVIFKNMLENRQILEFVKQDCGEEVFKHKDFYRAVTGSQNINNPCIRVLNSDFKDVKPFDSPKKVAEALLPLKIAYLNESRAEVAHSLMSDEKKRVQILKINKMLAELEEQKMKF